jgi:uncharacterized protein (TIGR01440 family)
VTELADQIKKDIGALLDEWIETDYVQAGDLFVIGCSTSEVAGEQIGTAGSETIAAILFDSLQHFCRQKKICLAFQCCEHLNRALVIEKETLKERRLEAVSVVPVPAAGGSMASYAFRHMDNAVVVESVEAQAGIDIGETMIGMHLKHVAVPLRFKQRFIGNARASAARTRPKLIGGERAVYRSNTLNDRCT